MRRAIVRSRSSKNSGFVGARGARWVVAKVSAGVMSPSGAAVALRMSSISCRRNNAKCRAESWSRILNPDQQALNPCLRHETQSDSKVLLRLKTEVN